LAKQNEFCFFGIHGAILLVHFCDQRSQYFLWRLKNFWTMLIGEADFSDDVDWQSAQEEENQNLTIATS